MHLKLYLFMLENIPVSSLLRIQLIVLLEYYLYPMYMFFLNCIKNLLLIILMDLVHKRCFSRPSYKY